MLCYDENLGRKMVRETEEFLSRHLAGPGGQADEPKMVLEWAPALAKGSARQARVASGPAGFTACWPCN
jgi:hypothetical protein